MRIENLRPPLMAVLWANSTLTKAGSCRPLFGCLPALVVLLAAQVHSAVVTYTNKTSFAAAGKIAYDSFFDDITSTFKYPGDPFTRGDVTYTGPNQQNVLYGVGQPLTVILNNHKGVPFSGTIASGPKYDMFGFQIGQGGPGTYEIQVVTSQATYTYPGLSIPPATGALAFFGYVASPGEYFQSFKITPSNTETGVMGITDVQVGTATHAALGEADPDFPDPKTDAWIHALAVQPDGRIVLGGGFGSVGSAKRKAIARFKADGTLDQGFNPDVSNTSYAGSVDAMTLQPDGQILVGGSFTSVGGVTVSNVARLKPDGTADSGFNPNANDGVATLAAQPDGKILLGGRFTKVGGAGRNYLARLNADGTLDTNFNAKISGSSVNCLALQPDGKALIGGRFTSAGGAGRQNIARFNADGTLDTGFNPNANSEVDAIAVQPDGKIVIGGSFTRVGGTAGAARNYMARLNEDGTLDTGFNPNLGPNPNQTLVYFYCLALQTDGKILLGGDFAHVGGKTGPLRTGLARLNIDGTLDTGFDAHLANGGDTSASALTVQSDGKILVGGDFRQVGLAPRAYFARLENDPGAQSLKVASASRIEWLRGGASSEAREVAFELSSDRGNTWTALGEGARTAGGWELTGLSLPASGLVRGRATVTGGLLGSMVAFPSNATPVLAKPLGDVVVNEDSAPTVIDLRGVFQDAETAASDLVYSLRVEATDDPQTISPTLDLATGVLTLAYGAKRHGAATITVRATDAVGLWAEDTFKATVRGVRDGDPGDLDTRYKPTPSLPGTLLAVQADGKAIVQGPRDQQTVGVPVQRLNADGSLDAGFLRKMTVKGYVNCAAVQTDGGILIGGDFTSAGLAGRTNMARLNADGTLDMGFNPTVRANSTDLGVVGNITVLADGKILVTGRFTRVNGTGRIGIARLNSDGTLDTTFAPNPSGFPQWADPFLEASIQADGRILVWGQFTKIGGVARNGLARLNADGTLDTGFNPNLTGDANPVGFINLVAGLRTLPDGRILVWGSLTRAGGAAHVGLVRLNADGTVDPGFNLGLDGPVNSVAFQADGKVLLNGLFTRAGGVTRRRMARLNADDALDPLFNPDIELQFANNSFTPAIEPDGEIVFGALVSTVGGLPATAQPGVGFPLVNDPGIQSLSATSGARIQWLRGGGLPEVTAVFFEMSVDGGATWSLLGGGTPIPGGWELTGLNLPASGLLRSHAWLNSGLVRTVATFPFNAPPTVAHPIADLAVTQGGPSTVIDLRTVFHDAETAASDLVYSVQANDNPALISATVNSATGALTLAYRTAQATESAVITVRVTDAAGQFIDDTFSVTVHIPQGTAPGSLDLAFNPNADKTVYSTAVQPDGKIVIGGSFHHVGGMARGLLARLNADDTVDTGFNPNISGTEPNDTHGNPPEVFTTAVQSDGKILVGGVFTAVGGTGRYNLARLNADGTLDAGLNLPVNDVVRCAVVQPDGKIVIGGYFTEVAGVVRNRLARLNADGTLDLSFKANADSWVTSAALQADGKIIIGGDFGNIDGVAREHCARLNADGTADASFNPNPNSYLWCVAVQPDAKILIGGEFTTVKGTARNHIARLNADGTLDTSFDPNADDALRCITLQADGKMILGGLFSTLGGVARNCVARLNANGTLDARFDPGANGAVRSIALLADGRVLIGGDFAAVRGEARGFIARLLNDPATQSLTAPNAGRVQWLRGGASPEGRDVTFDLSNDGGGTWTALGAGVRIAGGWELTGLDLPAGGLLRARARVASGTYGGSAGLVETVLPFSGLRSAPPRLTALTRLGNGHFQFGFTGHAGLSFTALATSDLSLPGSAWTVLGAPTEISPGQYQVADPGAANDGQRFYLIRLP